jgi:hypothetical protein
MAKKPTVLSETDIVARVHQCNALSRQWQRQSRHPFQSNREAKKPTVLSETDIVARVTAKAREAVGWYDSRLSRERERVTRYYNCLLPKRQHEGSSTYVSTDVYDSVETMKAQLLEVFSGNEEIFQFDPDQDMSMEDCRVATEYARYVFFRANDGFSIMEQVIHDGLTSRAGPTKVYFEENYNYEDHEFSSLSHDDAYALAAHDETDEFDGTQQPDGSYSGNLTRKKPAHKICVEAIAPEEFLIEARASSVKKSGFTSHRTLKTRADLKAEGYDPKKIALIPHGDESGINDTPEVIARNEPVENGQVDTAVDPQMDKVEVYESYVRMQVDSSKGARLYQIIHCHNVILEGPNEVDCAPFFAYVPLPVPHTFYGNNFAARCIPTQNARTVLIRGVLDHTAITTNPRWAVVSGGLLNPREMLENRLGGLVNVRRPDSIAPLPQNNLNPFVFEVIKQLTADKEEFTGISSLSKGLNKDAISSQNSSALIDQMMTAAGQRQKIAARNFAHNWFIPIMLEIVRLAIVNKMQPEMIEVAGAPMKVDPQSWTERKTATVSMHLGYGEKDMMVQKMQNTAKELAGDPGMSNMFTDENRYNIVYDTMKLAGLSRASNYITHPSKVQPKQPDPLKTKELEIKDKLAEASIQNAQANQAKAQKGMVIDSQRMDNERHSQLLDAMDKDRTHNRQDLETTARIAIDKEELRLQEKEVDNQAATVAVNASLRP